MASPCRPTQSHQIHEPGPLAARTPPVAATLGKLASISVIRLDKVTKRFGETVAVDELSLEVGTGELCVLVGPSGCGKTTTMKMVNRLIEPSGGRIFLGDDEVTHVDPVKLRRRI